MVTTEKLKKIHLELIEFLKTDMTNVPRIDEFISYVELKFKLYEKYEKSRNKNLLSNITKGLNRYRDEFSFDYKSIKKMYIYFDQIDSLIHELP